MDLLGSILNSMDKPPTISEKDKEINRRQKEHIEKMKAKEKEHLISFRKYVEGRLERFLRDERKFIEFSAMNNVYRTVIHDVAEVGGFVGLSFGQEGVDRYTVIYKKEYAPTEDEIRARRNGEDWNDEKAKEYAAQKKKQKEEQPKKIETVKDIIPVSNYKDKYVHLIGQEAALKAARKTESNKIYGFVPSENKKDVRSIEQTMADIKARKRMRLQEMENSNNNAC